MTTKSNTVLLDELEKKIIHLQEQIKNNDEEILALNARKNIYRLALDQAEFDKEVIQQKMFIAEGIDPDLALVRRQITNRIDFVKRKDIKVAEKESTEKEIPTLVATLQTKCNHRLVLDYPGFGGSPINDYNDKYRGERVCAICTLVEVEKHPGKDDYEVLFKNKSCLVKRDRREKEKIKPYGMWTPLHDIITAFANAVDKNFIK